MTNGHIPDYDVFLREPRGSGPIGWAGPFLDAMEPGVPVRCPQHGKGSDLTLVAAARRRGLDVRKRTFGSDAWVCLMRTEDARPPRKRSRRTAEPA